jgi:hypothetical protein
MPLLVTNAAGTNGDGYGALLAFDSDGKPFGAFSDDSRIVDPRGLSVDRSEGLLFLISGSDRVLALGADGKAVRRRIKSRRGELRARQSLLRRLAERAHSYGVCALT